MKGAITRITVAASCIALVACVQTEAEVEGTEAVAGRETAVSDLPALLRDNSSLRMEALPAGKLTRRGDCLYLEKAPGLSALILWGDKDVKIARLDDDDWLVNNYTTGQRFREGDMIRGGGGWYPRDASLPALADPDPPETCAGPAVQLYDVRKFDPDTADGVPPPPPPPPPEVKPWRSPLLDQAFEPQSPGFVGPRRTITAVADPLEAMFIYTLQDYRSWEGVHKCLSDSDAAMLARLEGRFGELHPGFACGWSMGQAVLTSNGEKATFINAQVDCSRKDRVGFCAGAAGAAYGNLGAEHWAYRLRRKGDGWEIERLGIGVIS